MKKIIKILCGIFILCTIVENINFIFAQFEDNEGFSVDEIIDSNLENKSDSNTGENLPLQVSKLDSEESEPVGSKENSSSKEITNSSEIGENLNITPSQKLKGVPMMTASQKTQNIDTSNYGIIRIKDPDNPGKGITIHDRNLGATATGYGATDDINTYGYYFQWGNNYGFPSDPSETILTDTTPVDSSEYGPHTNNGYYSSDTFIKGNSDWSSVRNDNLRGGEGDSKDSNNRGYPIENPTSRRGPCPKNYHVPSAGEWSKLLEFLAKEYPGIFLEMEDNGLYKLKNNSSAVNEFNKKFYIPKAGQRDNNANIKSINDWILLRSSSPKNSTDSFRLYGNSNDIFTNGENPRSYAFPVRCFYNSYWLPIKITYKTNGGYWTDDESIKDKIITYTKDNDNSEFSGNIALGTVKRDNNCGESGNKKCMFGGRYTLTEDELWTGNITEDITLYAKWLEFDDKDISYSGVNFSIIDRNLGAINSGIDENAYGYYLTGGEEDIMCPEGYHIPSTGEWIGIKNLLGSDFSGNLIKDLFNLPFAGKFINGEVVEHEGNGYYLARDGDEIKYAKISNSDIEIKNLDEGEKVSARCFKDYNTGTIKFYPNGGEAIADITAVNRREDGQSLNDAERDNSIFSGWYTTIDFKEGSKLEKNINYRNEEEINLYAKWECEEGYTEGDDKCDAIYFDIAWIDGDGNILKTDSVKWGDIPIYDGNNPTKSSNSSYNYKFNGKWLPDIVVAYGDARYTAQFDEEIIKKSGGYSGGGGRINRQDSIISNVDSASGDSDKSTEYQTGNKVDSSTSYQNDNKSLSGADNSVISNDSEKSTDQLVGDIPIDFLANPRNDKVNSEGQTYPQEFIDAYNFACKYGITSKTSIQDAKMYSPLTRIQMAKMLSNYAINILGKNPDISKGTIKFDDVSNKLNKEYDNAVSLAYQLGIMGQNIKSNQFRPYDKVTRAEFSTALSRLLYGIEDGQGIIKYYEPHIAKLYDEGIISKSSFTMIETRGYVFVMLIKGTRRT